MTIEASNRLIATFMNVKPYEDSRYGTLYTSPLDGRTTCFALLYHSSWDWLMTVVEKIEGVEIDHNKKAVRRTSADVKIFYKACIITYEADEDFGDENENTVIEAKGETKIDAVYKGVVKFIQWYNTQKPNP